MAREPRGVSSLEQLEAVLRNPAVYALAEGIPDPAPHLGGRRRSHPKYMLLVFDALISVYGSARQVEAELAHPIVWAQVRGLVEEMFPGEASMHLPAEPFRRYHYVYGRNRYLADPQVLRLLGELHRELAVGQARELGLLDPEGGGSWTHPDLDRVLHADGKVITPLYRPLANVDKENGEIRSSRQDPDARLHFEGDGEAAWGTKFVLVAVRTQHVRGRVILDLEWVPSPGGEAAAAMACFERTLPLAPGTQAIVYDTALRGVHHQRLLRELGVLSINRVAAAEKGARAPRRKQGRRVEKSAHVMDRQVRLPSGEKLLLHMYSSAGAIGFGELDDRGSLQFTELRRVRTHRTRDKSGLYRWYNDYALPATHGGGIVTVRLHGNQEDRDRRFNRAENVRPIPPSDPDFHRIYSRRNDTESINRNLEDTLWLGRAHSLGHARQHVELLGYALLVNGLALLQHRARSNLLLAA